MNVGIILSGGCGKRFGDDLPKQYHKLNGRTVIDYVVDALLKSKTIDEIVLVIDKEYLKYVTQISNPRIHCVSNGKERVDSILNALDFINENYVCSKVIITQAVSPLITSEIVDEYINLLDNYNVVTTAEKCVGEIFNINKFERIKRDEYYFCQSPEAFNFKELLDNIDRNSEYTELIYHYKVEPKIYFYTEFKNNIKITYKRDLMYCEALLNEK